MAMFTVKGPDLLASTAGSRSASSLKPLTALFMPGTWSAALGCWLISGQEPGNDFTLRQGKPLFFVQREAEETGGAGGGGVARNKAKMNSLGHSIKIIIKDKIITSLLFAS